jgi:hypothetical protein
LIIINKNIINRAKITCKQYCFPENKEIVAEEVFIAISLKKND